MRKRSIEPLVPGIHEEQFDQSFPKHLRVRKSREIDHVFKDGARFSCKGMRMQVLKTGEQESRAAFIAVRSFPALLREIEQKDWRGNRGGCFDIESSQDMILSLCSIPDMRHSPTAAARCSICFERRICCDEYHEENTCLSSLGGDSSISACNFTAISSLVPFLSYMFFLLVSGNQKIWAF